MGEGVLKPEARAADAGTGSPEGPLAVKICGITDAAALATAVEGGASHIGLVFYPPSPRSVPLETAGLLARGARARVHRVGVVVDPDDRWLDRILDAVPLDLLQLHGHETPDRVAEIRARTGLGIIKAVRVADGGDLDDLQPHAETADWLLFDAKPPKRQGSLPGGNGEAFDWSLLSDLDPGRPWFLSGGLDALTLGAALAVLRPDGVDVSSGVERAPGVKDPTRIAAFLDVAAAVGNGRGQRAAPPSRSGI